MKRAASTLASPGAKQFALFDSPLGPCAVVWGEGGICRVVLPERSRKRTVARVRALFDDARESKPSKPVKAVIAALVRQLKSGASAPIDPSMIDLSEATPFAAQVSRALCKIPAGRTVTYGELAQLAGSPKAARAVGRVMATNPVPLLVPCHRVLGKDGKPVGFTAYGGIATKAKLLALEGVTLETTAATSSRGAKSSRVATQPRALPFSVRTACRHLRRADPQLAALMEQVGPVTLALEPCPTTFAAVAEAIVYQQLTAHAAAAIFDRVCALFPRRRALSAAHVAAASEKQLRSAGLSRAKAAALKDLAAKAIAGKVPKLRELDAMNDEAIIDKLTRVKGVGRWTVEMLLIFRLGRPDVLPVGDYALCKAFGSHFGLDEVATPKQLATHGERWHPYRTIASWYLWRALEL